MTDYDVIIIGAATSGAYFANRLAKLGYKVKVIEKSSYETVGNKYDIFHISREDFKKFNLPEVSEDSESFAFSFTDNHFSSPTNKYIIDTKSDIIGLHMHEYVKLMNDIAVESGAKIEYNSEFVDFIYEKGHINGIRYKNNNGTSEITSEIVIDCSGYTAKPRCSLPQNYGIETFSLTSDDLFYVVLRYAEFENNQINNFWLNFKSWYAPFSFNENEKIIGTGATGSFEKTIKVSEKLDKTLNNKFKVIKTETGFTPYTRPPYSFVADNFIVAGDAACQTKPENGEGVTSSLVMIDIAVKVIDCAFKKKDFSKKSLWDINSEYNHAQGADFSMIRAFLTKIVNNIKDEEIEYCFSKGLIFNSKFLNNEKIGPEDIISTVNELIKGLAKKKISGNTLKSAASGLSVALKLRKHYLDFPENPDGLKKWSEKAEKLWDNVGKVQ